MNYLLDSNIEIQRTDSGKPYGAYAWMGEVAKLSSIRHSSDCFLLVEESSATINDGQFIGVNSPGPASAGTTVSGSDYLSVRHDRTAKLPEKPESVASSGGADFLARVPNARCRGNAAFCDGHADYVTRQYVNDPLLRHWDPSN
jgi:prepilin-type processing-associated H-X9-DG protein